MSYAKLNASFSKQQQPINSISKANALSISYNPVKPVAPVVNAAVTPSAQGSTQNVPNTIVQRDSTGSIKVGSARIYNSLQVDGTLQVSNSTVISGTLTTNNNVTIHGDLKLNGILDTKLGTGVVFSSSQGILSSRALTIADIAGLANFSSNIPDFSISSAKLQTNLRLTGTPMCNTPIANNEHNITNVGYIKHYVHNYTINYIRPYLNSLKTVNPNNPDNCGCDEVDYYNQNVDEKNPVIFHVTVDGYTLLFDYATYVIEAQNTSIVLPMKRREGYTIKIYNKSGNVIVVNSNENRVMYNSTYAFSGTTSQIVEDNRCITLTYVYAGNERSWSFTYV